MFIVRFMNYSTTRELWATLLISDSREYPVLKNLTSVMSSLFIVLCPCFRGPCRACARHCIVLDSDGPLTDLWYPEVRAGPVSGTVLF